MEDFINLVVYGMGPVAIVYWLTQKARAVKLVTSPKVAFMLPGILWLLITALWALAQPTLPAWYLLLLYWLGGWVATMLFKAGVKDNERSERSAPPTL